MAHDEDKHLAARLANGESLASVLGHVRHAAWEEGYQEGYDDSDTGTFTVTRNPYDE